MKRHVRMVFILHAVFATLFQGVITSITVIELVDTKVIVEA